MATSEVTAPERAGEDLGASSSSSSSSRPGSVARDNAVRENAAAPTVSQSSGALDAVSPPMTSHQRLLLLPVPTSSAKMAPSISGSAKLSRVRLSEASQQRDDPVLITQLPELSDGQPRGDDKDRCRLPPAQTVAKPLSTTCECNQGSDDEYDTDLEMDLEEWLMEGRRKLDDDDKGEKAYRAACEEAGVTPSSYFLRHMGERELVMRFHGLGPSGAKALSTPLKTNNTIEKLDLEGNCIKEIGGASFANVLTENNYISDLVLSENKIGDDGVMSLCEILCKNYMINTLDLSGNDLTDRAAESICAMLKQNSTLKHLILRHNRFEERGAQCFKEALQANESLETLDLSWNRFRTRGATLITEGIQENYGLRCLNLAMNGLGEEGASDMGRALGSNRTLQQLDISFNRVSGTGASHIALGLQANDVLQGLKISSNPIGSVGALAILSAVDHNDSGCLTYLELKNVEVNQEFIQLHQKLKAQRNVVVIYDIFMGENSADPPEAERPEPDDWWVRDPLTKLRKCVREYGCRLMSLLRECDTRGSNTAARDDFLTAIKQSGIRMNAEQIEELLQKLDKDNSGMVDYSELLSEGDKVNHTSRDVATPTPASTRMTSN